MKMVIKVKSEEAVLENRVEAIFLRLTQYTKHHL